MEGTAGAQQPGLPELVKRVVKVQGAWGHLLSVQPPCSPLSYPGEILKRKLRPYCEAPWVCSDDVDSILSASRRDFTVVLRMTTCNGPSGHEKMPRKGGGVVLKGASRVLSLIL